nr:xyloglucan galactosyltransferase MUR3 [Tanacetum cinerariifolium]
MEKGTNKSQQSRVCVLGLLCLFFWGFLLYFHFVVIGGRSYSISPDPITPHPVPTRPIDNSPSLYNAADSTSDSRDLVVDQPQKHDPDPVAENADSTDSVVDQPIKRDQELVVENGHSTDSVVDQPIKREQELLVENGDGSRKKEEYLFMKALRTAENVSDPCGGRYVYVHDLPSRFNEDMLKQCRSLSKWTNMCKFTTNAGLGPPLENDEGVFSEKGWYATNQFAVDVIFSNRMKQYECLTKDSSLAAAIFVPFYAGFDIARYLWGYNISMRDAASIDLVEWLQKRPEWGIMGGNDHFLVAGRITWDFRRLSEDENDWGNKLLFLPAAKNMSMLVVESSPWNANDFAIPYPTYFHPSKDAEVFAWQDRMMGLDRKWLFCFAGAPRPDNPKSIRGQIIDQCKSSPVGKLLECDLGESKCHSPSSIMQMFQSSVFCLQPQGDSYTRRSAFDSMLAGCIPVFFHPGSAYTQYVWHLPKNYSKYSVFIPEDDLRKKKISIEERLSQIPQDQVKKMREEVINLIPGLIYADPRSKLDSHRDAFDVSVQAIINKVTRMRKDIIEGRTNDDFIEELSWKYALLDEGESVGVHEWDPFFSKPKPNDGNSDSDGSAAKAAENSWKNEQRDHS